MAICFVAVVAMHRASFGDAENTEPGMLIYHGSAALCDYLTIVFAAHALEGQISYDMQRLGLCALVVNFLGWIAYLAYIPPVAYDMMIATIGYVQWARLLWIGRDDFNHLGRGLVHRDNSVGPEFHLTEAHQ